MSVFINCPFTDDFKAIFNAYVFAVVDLGYRPRCALEHVDGGEIRLQKIERIIQECKFGIHDLSNMELDKKSGLPRFNMPFELGLFLGARRYGVTQQKQKRALIVDRKLHRYQKAISDISGQDVQSHRGLELGALTCVRDWLQTSPDRKTIPGADHLAFRYRAYKRQAPKICAAMHLNPQKLTFVDLHKTIFLWQQARFPRT